MSPATPFEMEAEMIRYFAAERAESARFLGADNVVRNSCDFSGFLGLRAQCAKWVD